jgi:hypothetical protein
LLQHDARGLAAPTTERDLLTPKLP